MPNPIEVVRRQFAIGDLYPEAGAAFLGLNADLLAAYKTGRTKLEFKAFEGFRSAKRQAHLLTIGTTKAGPWQSAHQFGLAVDYVPQVNGDWTWERDDWANLHAVAKAAGFVAGHISWDPGHVEHELWLDLKKHLR